MKKTVRSPILCFGVALLCGSSCAPAKTGRVNGPGVQLTDTPCKKAWNSMEAAEAARPNVVRVVQENGSGTGFLIATGDGDQLVATNYHVIASGSEFKLEVPMGGKSSTVLAQVVKTDQAGDLALLSVPRGTFEQDGLVLGTYPVQVGQSVGAAGFPGVRGADVQVTFESGEVTSQPRSIEGFKGEFIQSNVNINPGNSGGPVVDACGAVVGVAVMKHLEADNVNFLVPTPTLVKLLESYDSRPDLSTGAKERLQGLFRAASYKEGEEAAAYFSRGFLARKVYPVFKQLLAEVQAEMEAIQTEIKSTGEPLNEEQFNKLFMERLQVRNKLNPMHVSVLELNGMINEGKIDAFSAMRHFLSTFVSALFGGEVADYELDRIDPDGEESGIAFVRVATPEGTKRYKVRFIYEWGDWQIDELVEV